ncbi:MULTISPECIES: copper homeostasis protein CutC [Falsihalocynthiibacter]|uniref:copper homeostasis protein CutC n=1 Tax=Falsihalocynthiibacter TaxID=2854182 RepID=UPI003002843D
MEANPFKLEVCIDTPEGLQACQNGVDTIELCSALAVGGLTPSAGQISLARTSFVPVHAIIRPRAGNFIYSPHEIDVALGDIDAVKSAKLDGIVIGASTAEAMLDLPVLNKMIAASGSLIRTLHRVIDTLDDPFVALDQAIDLGFSRILTSGSSFNAQDGMACLRKLQERARGRIEIVAGSGVNARNILEIGRATGVRSFHASCSSPVEQDKTTVGFGFAPEFMNKTDPQKIKQLRSVLDAAA